MTTDYDIRFNGEINTFDLSTTPQNIYNGAKDKQNCVGKKPRHGEDVVSHSYLPPPLIYFPNDSTTIPTEEKTAKANTEIFTFKDRKIINKYLTLDSILSYASITTTTEQNNFINTLQSDADITYDALSSLATTKYTYAFEGDMSITTSDLTSANKTYLIFVDGDIVDMDITSTSSSSKFLFICRNCLKITSTAINSYIICYGTDSIPSGSSSKFYYNMQATYSSITFTREDNTDLSISSLASTTLTSNQTIKGRNLILYDTDKTENGYSFGSTFNKNDVSSFMIRLFKTQYNVDCENISVDENYVKLYFNNLHTYIVYQENQDSLTNMRVHTEPINLNNTLDLEDGTSALHTYRITDKIFIPIGNPGNSAGYYMTFDSSTYTIKPSSSEFQFPNFTSFVLDGVTIDTFTSSTLLGDDMTNNGMDYKNIYRKLNFLKEPQNQVVNFYSPNSTFYRFRAYGSKGDFLALNNYPSSKVDQENNVQLRADSNALINIYDTDLLNEEDIIYVDKEEICFYHGGMIKEIFLQDNPSTKQFSDGKTYTFSVTDNDYTISENGGTFTLTNSLPGHVGTQNYDIRFFFGDTLIKDPQIETYEESIMSDDSNLQIYTRKLTNTGEDYIYQRNEYLSVDGRSQVFDYRGIMLNTNFVDAANIITKAGLDLLIEKHYAYRTKTPEDPIFFLDAKITFNGLKKIKYTSSPNSVSFNFNSSDPSVIIIRDDGSLEEVDPELGVVDLTTPFTYKNITYVGVFETPGLIIPPSPTLPTLETTFISPNILIINENTEGYQFDFSTADNLKPDYVVNNRELVLNSFEITDTTKNASIEAMVKGQRKIILYLYTQN